MRKNKQINHIWNIMSKNRNILPTRNRFLFQVLEKLKECRSSKLKFSSSYFVADDCHVKSVWLRVVVFSEHDILDFRDNDFLPSKIM